MLGHGRTFTFCYVIIAYLYFHQSETCIIFFNVLVGTISMINSMKRKLHWKLNPDLRIKYEIKYLLRSGRCHTMWKK